MKAMLIDIVIAMFCATGMFFTFLMFCYLVNPENITGTTITIWLFTAVIDTVVLYVWREENK